MGASGGRQQWRAPGHAVGRHAARCSGQGGGRGACMPWCTIQQPRAGWAALAGPSGGCLERRCWLARDVRAAGQQPAMRQPRNWGMSAPLAPGAAGGGGTAAAAPSVVSCLPAARALTVPCLPCIFPQRPVGAEEEERRQVPCAPQAGEGRRRGAQEARQVLCCRCGFSLFPFRLAGYLVAYLGWAVAAPCSCFIACPVQLPACALAWCAAGAACGPCGEGRGAGSLARAACDVAWRCSRAWRSTGERGSRVQQ